MPHAKTLLTTGLMIGCLGLLGFAGKKAGQQLARAGIFERSGPKEMATPGNTGPRDKESHEPAQADLVASSIKRLNALADNSPNLGVDWEAQAQIDAIIAKLNAAELAEVFVSMGGNMDRGLHLIVIKVGLAWMAKDPDAAIRAAQEKMPRSNGYLARSIFGTWAQEDPKAALAWLGSADLPENPATLREELRKNALVGLAERDFELATAEFLKMERSADGKNDYANPMLVWGDMYADDPVMRDRLVAFAKTTGRPEDYATLNHQLLKEWPQEDAMGMMNYLNELRGYLESDAVPTDVRQKVDGAAVAAAIYREYDRPALEWWMERYGQSSEAPAPMREAMDQWAQKYPDAMLSWFEEQPPSPQRDALTTSVIPALIQQKKFAEAAASIAGMQDPGIRQAATERLDMLWSEQDANGAAVWRASLCEGTLDDPDEQ